MNLFKYNLYLQICWCFGNHCCLPWNDFCLLLDVAATNGSSLACQLLFHPKSLLKEILTYVTVTQFTAYLHPRFTSVSWLTAWSYVRGRQRLKQSVKTSESRNSIWMDLMWTIWWENERLLSGRWALLPMRCSSLLLKWKFFLLLFWILKHLPAINTFSSLTLPWIGKWYLFCI